MASTTIEVGASIDSSVVAPGLSLRASVEAQLASLQVAALNELFGPSDLGTTLDVQA